MIFLKKYLKNLMQKWALIPYYNLLTQGVERGNPVVRYERARRATPKSGLEQSLEEATRQLEEFGRLTISTPGGQPVEYLEEVQVATPQAEEVPWTWATKRFFVNDVKISAEKMRNGDLDIVLMPKCGEPLSHERKLREIKFLVREFRLMQRQYHYRHCVAITKTKAPLVKIRTSEDVDVDITIDNSEALRNSNWLAEQMKDSKLWRLYMAVKVFAKHNGIGDASCGGLNSLSWAIMTKHFAASRGQEHCETPLLDFLQMAEYFSEFPFEGYTITTTGWRERKSSSAPIYVEDPHNSEDNCARNRQAQDVCRVKKQAGARMASIHPKKGQMPTLDLGFPEQNWWTQKTLVRPTTQQSAMVCNQAAHPQIMELTNNFQCDQLTATKLNATLEVFKPVKRVSEIKAAYCNIIHKRVVYWKNVIFEWHNTTTSKALPTERGVQTNVEALSGPFSHSSPALTTATSPQKKQKGQTASSPKALSSTTLNKNACIRHSGT
ncbi:hypothetical protein niasHT_025646 [Heterodera trifolii]|uniref:Poly(A) RNA polymerase mitochondrial-like central palm domain-containing protein n=1 Tax=Heterodera trifolii TaxID=157864 RepID=A0ABD2KHR4_9BILA